MPHADKDEGFHVDDQAMLNDVAGAAATGLLVNIILSRRGTAEWRKEHGQVRQVHMPPQPPRARIAGALLELQLRVQRQLALGDRPLHPRQCHQCWLHRIRE